MLTNPIWEKIKKLFNWLVRGGQIGISKLTVHAVHQWTPQFQSADMATNVANWLLRSGQIGMAKLTVQAVSYLSID